jgi:hypothetical protein
MKTSAGGETVNQRPSIKYLFAIAVTLIIAFFCRYQHGWATTYEGRGV